MNLTAMFIAALILLPAFALVIWTLRAMARVEEKLRAFSDFEGMHLEV